MGACLLKREIFYLMQVRISNEETVYRPAFLGTEHNCFGCLDLVLSGSLYQSGSTLVARFVWFSLWHTASDQSMFCNLLDTS